MQIEAYRRSKVLEIDLMGEVVKFMPNKDGKFVADIKKEAIYRRLLEIPDAYRVLGATVGEVNDGNDDDDDTGGDAASPFILTQEGDNGEEVTIDLRKLDREGLNKFCDDNDIPKLPKNAKDETVRNKIVAFFKVD